MNYGRSFRPGILTEFKLYFRRELEYYFRHAFIHLFCGFVATTFGLFVIFDKPISRNMWSEFSVWLKNQFPVKSFILYESYK